MVGSAVASATTGSEVNFGLTKAKNMMFYTPEKFPPHDKDAWKQYSNLTCDELRPLLFEKKPDFAEKRMREVKLNRDNLNISYLDALIETYKKCPI